MSLGAVLIVAGVLMLFGAIEDQSVPSVIASVLRGEQPLRKSDTVPAMSDNLSPEQKALNDRIRQGNAAGAPPAPGAPYGPPAPAGMPEWIEQNGQYVRAR